jgi:uncharacterized membrane protein YbjE (DUF340 family)
MRRTVVAAVAVLAASLAGTAAVPAVAKAAIGAAHAISSSPGRYYSFPRRSVRTSS